MGCIAACVPSIDAECMCFMDVVWPCRIRRHIDNSYANNLDSERLKSSDCQSCQSPSQNPLVKNVYPPMETSSLDSYDHVQRKDETNVGSSTSKIILILKALWDVSHLWTSAILFLLK